MAPKRKREQPRTTSLQVVVDVGASSGSSCVGSTRKYDIACSLVESLAFEEEAELELGLVFCGSDETSNQLEGYDNTEIMFPLLPLHEAPVAIQAAFSAGPSSRTESDLFGSLVVALDSLAQRVDSFRVLLLITDGISSIATDDAQMFTSDVLPGLIDNNDVLHVIILGASASAATKEFLFSAALSTGGRVLEGVSSATDCQELLAHILTARLSSKLKLAKKSSSSSSSSAAPMPLYFLRPTPCGSREYSDRGWDWRRSATGSRSDFGPAHLSGKWVLFPHHFGGGSAGLINAWNVLREPFEAGLLGPCMKISDEVQFAIEGSGVICIYTVNHRDPYDVMRVLLSIRRVLGLRGRLDYKTDDSTLERGLEIFDPHNLSAKPTFATTFCKFHSPSTVAGPEGVVNLRLNGLPKSKKSSLVAEFVYLEQALARVGEDGCFLPSDEMMAQGGSKATAFDGEGVMHIAILEPEHEWDKRARRALEEDEKSRAQQPEEQGWEWES